MSFFAAGRCPLDADTISVSAGTSAAPGIGFDGDANTGIYRVAADTAGVTAGGALALSVGAATVKVPSGTSAAPGIAFLADTDVGIYRIGANNLGVTVGGAKVLDLTATTVAVPAGTSAAPGLSFFGDSDTGIYRAAANGLSITVGGASAAAFASGSVTFANAMLRGIKYATSVTTAPTNAMAVNRFGSTATNGNGSIGILKTGNTLYLCTPHTGTTWGAAVIAKLSS